MLYEVETLLGEDRAVVKRLLDGFLMKKEVQALVNDETEEHIENEPADFAGANTHREDTIFVSSRIQVETRSK